MNIKTNTKCTVLVLICLVAIAICAKGDNTIEKDKTFKYGKPTLGFAMAISLQVKFIDLGYVVQARVRVKNVSTKTSKLIIIDKTIQYFFKATTPTGEVIPSLLYQKDIDRRIAQGVSPLRIFAQKVKPGEFLEYKFDMSRRFDFSLLEKYTVQCRRKLVKYDSIKKKKSIEEIVSPKVLFSIK